MGRNNGGIKWNLKGGATQLLVNLHFTGGRTFRINYTLADGTSKTVNISKQSKGTYCSWNVLEKAGITDGTKIRSIELLNSNSSGEVRIYDMYIRVPDKDAPTTISVCRDLFVEMPLKVVHGDRIIIFKNGRKYNAQGLLLK